MKITTVFFRHNNFSVKNIEKYFGNIVSIGVKSIYCVIVLGILIFIACSIKISPKILYFATNFRQAEKINIKLVDCVKLYGLYNKSNYIISKTENENIQENEKNVDKKDIEFMSEIQIIDSVADENNNVDVFSNSNIDVNVTSENNTLQRIDVGAIKVLNYSDIRDINFKEMFNGNITLTKISDKILLYNTHTSESYANSENYKFDYTGTRRTTDSNYNMLAIASAFCDNLNSKGFKCIHDTTPHDYGTYTSSYSRSRVTVKNALEKMEGASICIDVHRDAIENLDYRPSANIKGIQVAQLMFVMGVGSDTTKNPYYFDNLKLAIRLQMLADKVYPGLFKPMIIRNSVYNQDLNKYSLLVEVGATGNTIEEAKLATRCLTNLLNIMYKD